MVSLGAASPLLLCLGGAPYGRYNTVEEKKRSAFRALTGCDVNAKVAWVLQECPTLIAAVGCWVHGSHECKQSVGSCLGLLCFVVHYANRTIIFPIRSKGSKPIPLPVMLLAMFFCTANGYIQCRSLTRYLVVPENSWTFPFGLVVWATGMWINTDADRILRDLRKPGEIGYKIPHGGMFTYVSGANFLGEIIEWFGYALALGGALPAVTFAVCTASNIGPRAVMHHKWYRDKFKDAYPKDRKALVPFLF
mmetsp:Transcript_86974/g.235699  ORF Transcript_86974/g.235699 Transcript_86974/m.235699 type:complete len:250 (+) Transcript_86974:67-816(+)